MLPSEKNQVIHAIELIKVMMEEVTKDDSIPKLVAKQSKMLYDSHLKSGFSQSESIQLTIAAIKARTKFN